MKQVQIAKLKQRMMKHRRSTAMALPPKPIGEKVKKGLEMARKANMLKKKMVALKKPLEGDEGSRPASREQRHKLHDERQLWRVVEDSVEAHDALVVERSATG